MSRCWRCGREYNTLRSMYCPDCELLKQQERAAAEARERESREREERKEREDRAREERARMEAEQEKRNQQRHEELLEAERERAHAVEQMNRDQAARHRELLAEKQKEADLERQKEEYSEASPRCKWCGEKYTFKNGDGFFEYCSRKCAKEDIGKDQLEQYAATGESALRKLFNEAIRQKNALQAYLISEGLSGLTTDEKCRLGYLLGNQGNLNCAIPENLYSDLLLQAVTDGSLDAAKHFLELDPYAVNKLYESILSSGIIRNKNLKNVIKRSLNSRSGILLFQKTLKKYSKTLPEEIAGSLADIAQTALFEVDGNECGKIEKSLQEEFSFPALQDLNQKLIPIIKDGYPRGLELSEKIKKKSEHILCDLFSQIASHCQNVDDYILLYTVCSGGNYGELSDAAATIGKGNVIIKAADSHRELPLIFSQKKSLAKEYRAKALEQLLPDAQEKIDGAVSYQDFIAVHAICQKLAVLGVENAQLNADHAKQQAEAIKKRQIEIVQALPLDPENLPAFENAIEQCQCLIGYGEDISKKLTMYQRKKEKWLWEVNAIFRPLSWHFLLFLLVTVVSFFPIGILLCYAHKLSAADLKGAFPLILICGSVFLFELLCVINYVRKFRRLGLCRPFYDLYCFWSKKSPENYQ